MATSTTDASCVGLTGFQRDVLATVARVGPEYGLAIKAQLESNGYSDVNRGRLYTNLDTLVEQDYVTKAARDERTNEYALTERGEGELADYHEWLARCYQDGEVTQREVSSDE